MTEQKDFTAEVIAHIRETMKTDPLIKRLGMPDLIIRPKKAATHGLPAGQYVKLMSGRWERTGDAPE